MKNTKKYLSTGIALAIALFAAVQVTAMEPNRTVNPHLSESVKERLQFAIETHAEHLDPKSNTESDLGKSMGIPNWGKDESYRRKEQARLDACKEIYYGNKPYTAVEMDEVIDKHLRRAKQ